MNRVLERQLKKVFGSVEKIPPGLEKFLELIGSTYDHADEDRLLIERSMEISSKEMGELNKKLTAESERIKTNIDELERMNKLMVDRELKMIELKKEIVALKARP